MMNVKSTTKSSFTASEQVNYIKDDQSSNSETELHDLVDDLKAIYHNSNILID
ncbi:MAG: hypothetical protein ACXAC7_09025 [Candidatus Hodarchaeales archaeon]|jgi:hypothetical protein